MPLSTEVSPRPKGLGLYLVFAVLYLFVVMPALKAPFIFDDGPGIVENPAVHAQSLRGVFRGSLTDSTPYGRPVVLLSLWLNQTLFGGYPFPFRVFNLLLHLFNGFLLLSFLRELPWPEQEKADPRVPLMVALLWLFHPLTTNVSLYIVQRAEGLMVLFYLLTLLWANRALSREGNASSKAWRWAALSAWLGMFCKESMVTIPAAVFFLDLGFHQGSIKQAFQKHKQGYLLLLSSWIPLFFVMTVWPRRHSVGAGDEVGALDYLFQQAWILPDYLLKILRPFPLHLDYWFLEPGHLSIAAGAVFLGLTFGWSLWKTLQGRPSACLVLLAFVVLSPTSSVIPVHSMPGAEYRMVLPLAFLLAAAGFTLSGRMNARLLPFLSLLLLGYFGFHSHLRARQLREPETVWAQILGRFPDHPRALNELAMFAEKRGELESARRLLRQAMDHWPQLGDAYANLGMLEGRHGNAVEAERLLAMSVERWPFSSPAWSNYGIALAQTGKLADAEQAFLRAISLAPHLPEPPFNLAILHFTRQNWEQGLSFLQQTLALDPNHAGALRIEADLRRNRP